MRATAPLADRVAAWFDRVLSTVAADAVGRRVVEVDAGPLTVTHTFVEGSSHATLSDALAGGVDPDERSPGRARLTIHSLEAPCTTVMLPSPVTEDELAGRVAPRELADTRWRLTWDAHAGVVRCYDRDTSTGIYVTASRPEAWEYGAPFRAFLHWAAAKRGAVMVHASTVVGAGGAALVVGPGGTGKSTTSLVGVEAGLGTVGDDYVWVEPDGDGFRVRSVYRTVKTVVGDRLPSIEVGERLASDDGAKTIHFVNDARRAHLVRSAPLAAVIVLGSDSSRSPAADALLGVLPSTTLQLPYDEGATTELLRRMCASTPVARLRRDGNLARLARELFELLDGRPTPSGRPSVTVAIPLYRGGDRVQRAIESVLAQQGWDLHVIVVDDGSDDESGAVVARLASADPRITLVSFDQNQGVAAARNAAIDRRRDPLLAMLDQDDRWTADRLDRGWVELESDDRLGFVVGHQEYELEGTERPDWVRERWLDGPQTGYQFGTWLAWRSTWELVGALDESLRSGTDDVDWFARAKDLEVPHVMVDEVIQIRTMHGENASQRTETSTRELATLLRRSMARRDQQAGAQTSGGEES